MDVLHDLVLPKLDGVRKQAGENYMARCPVHDDRQASLSISRGKTQPVVFDCKAGCDRHMVLDAIGITWDQICKPREDDPRRGEWTPHGEAVVIYDYVNEDGKLLFQVCRTAGKQFPQRRPDPSSKTGWTWRVSGVRRVLYRLPRIIEAVKVGQTIWIVEGEKDVHALEGAGCVATCNPGGAGKWRPEYSEVLRDADVSIVADRDDPGQAHARQVRDSLNGVARYVRIVEAAHGKDAADHLVKLSVDQFTTMWTSDEAPSLDLAPDLWEFLATEDAPYDWIVPYLIERGDRIVWTGFEGLGKSMFTRQLAVTVAAGLDPFLWKPIEPKKVLLIDCENSEKQSKRKFRPLADASVRVQRRVPDGALRLIHKPRGVDLTRPDDAAWLLERATAHEPDLIIIGPFYRLHAADMNDERAARQVVGVLDEVRAKADAALFIEAHAGHGEHGKNRSVRPVGSSLLMRWPEFGYGIAPAEDPAPGQPCRDVHVKAWRGARDERSWPSRLVWGDPDGWPWQVAPEEAGRW